MTPEFEIIATLVGFFGFGGMVLVGLRMILSHRAGRPGAGGEDLRALREEVLALRDEMLAVRGDLTDLTERVDFAERVLAQSRQGEQHRLPEH